ncbi:MAG: polyprenyl diphosphate synthase [Candidatus Hydrogenedentes bacterium]|nr:polyprenyl diphosphate synthase [Candidatus Hydrogenedentota bacterium]
MPDLDMTRLPKHIAIIMDGNGRWAEKHGVSRAEGHEAGAKSVRAAVEACRELEGVKALSLYAFSTENWRRSQDEINTLFELLSKYIHLELENIHKEDIRVTIIGRREGLSKRILDDLQYCEERTRNNKSMIFNVGINYGGRAEITDVARRLAREAAAGEIKPEDIHEGLFAKRLYVPELSEVDLLIRTSGEMRLSNFMLWQVSYAEIVSLGVLWPDFRKRHLLQAIERYQRRHRRFGGR